MKIFGGIDPGKTGAIVFLKEDGSIYKALNVPLIGREYHIKEMFAILYNFSNKESYIALEDVHTTQMGGKSSNFDFGRGKGIWEALLVSTGIPTIQVMPKKWQKEIWVENDKVYKKNKIKNKKGEVRFKINTKETSLQSAKRLQPNYSFINTGKSGRGKKINDGIVDAYLIAEYRRRNFKNNK